MLLLVAAVHAAPQMDDQAIWRVAEPGLPAVSGSLFLWHDDWKYEVPKEVKREGDAVTGWLTGSAGGAKVSFRAQARTQDDALQVTYTFRRDPATTLSSGMWLLVTLPLEPVAKRAVRFSHGLPQLAAGGFSGAGDGISLNLDDQHAFNLHLDRFAEFTRRRDQANAVAINVRLLPRDFPAGVDVPVTLTVGLGPAGTERLPWQLAEQKKLALTRCTAPAAPVAVNDTATIDVGLDATYDNPFDPDQVALDAAITGPDGRGYTLPGYFDQEFKADRVQDTEVLQVVGEPRWRVRFTPTQAGRWTVVLTARDRSGQVRSEPLVVNATGSKLPGMIHVGSHHNVFVRDTGGSLFLIGHNVPTYLTGKQSMADGLDQMAAGGENFNRFWMYSGHLGLEWGQPVGTYRLQEAWRLDHAMELARERGISVMLCMDTHQDFRESLKQNPYYVDRGGPIATPLEYFTNEQARKLYRQRLRYVVARWAHCTNLVAWEFVNEIEGWDGFTTHQTEVAAWHTEMAMALRGLDPYAHPITTSCWTTDGWPTLWNAPGLDVVQSHHYANTRVDMAERTADICAQKRKDYPGRLHLFGEMGIDSRWRTGQGDDEDPSGLHLHKQSWAALMSGAASVPCNWWHESYFEPHQLYSRFKGIAAFTRGLDLDREWQPFRGGNVAWIRPRPPERKDLEFHPKADAWKPRPAPTVVLHHDGTSEGLLDLPTLLQGNGHKDLRVPFTFQLDMPADGAFVLHVVRASNNPRLLAELDGKPVLDKPYPTDKGLGKESVYREQWKLWETLYDEELSLPVPAGKHTLVLHNEGNDWLAVDGYRVTGYVLVSNPPIEAMGLSDGHEAMLWVRNTNHWWLPVSRGEAIAPVEGARLTLPVLPAGPYTLERWNTDTGQVEARTPVTLTGHDTYDLPAIATDVAFRLRPRTGQR